MEKYKSNQIIIDAIVCAAAKVGSFKLLAQAVCLPEVTVLLIADGQMDELSKNSLEALMPKIREFLPGEEKNNILEFLNGPVFQREYRNIAAKVTRNTSPREEIRFSNGTSIRAASSCLDAVSSNAKKDFSKEEHNG